MMKIAIVGGGAAGTACATRLRRLNENDEMSKTAKRLSAPRRNR